MKCAWEDFKFPKIDEFLPSVGDGGNKATQASTAVSKLVYKWFNDGDVYDNHYELRGWANDISGSANWLYNYVPETRSILNRIKTIKSNDEYSELLYDLCSIIEVLLTSFETEDKVGDVYDETGRFSFEEIQSEDDDW